MADVTEHFVQQYHTGVDALVQQGDSRFRGSVTIEPVGPGKQHFFDQLGQTQMSRRTERHADTKYTEQDHQRRMCGLEDFDCAALIDDPDKIRVLNDPTNPYSQAIAKAALRNIDDVIIAAMLGTAQTGETGITPIGADASITSTGKDFDTDLAIEIKTTFDSAEVDDGDRFITMNAYQMGKLLSDANAKFDSHDFNEVKALVEGRVDRWLGMTFIRSERLEHSGSDIKCFAWHKEGLKLAVAKDTIGRITELPTKRYSTQVFYCHTLGAVRMQEAQVIQFLLDREA